MIKENETVFDGWDVVCAKAMFAALFAALFVVAVVASPALLAVGLLVGDAE